MTLLAYRLEDMVAEDNEVRLIDEGVDALDMESHGFKPPSIPVLPLFYAPDPRCTQRTDYYC